MHAKRIAAAVAFVTLALLAASPLAAGPFHLSFGVTVGDALPAEAVRVRVERERFFLYHGSFYQQVAQGYVLVAAPAGAFVKELPRGALRFTHAGDTYYHHAGVCYQPVRRGFTVCELPEGATENIRAAEAAKENQLTVIRDGETYTFQNGIFFRTSADGRELLATPMGAIAREYPPDAMSVWFRGVEYFEANGVFFREVPGGFRVTSAPWPSALEIAATH